MARFVAEEMPFHGKEERTLVLLAPLPALALGLLPLRPGHATSSLPGLLRAQMPLPSACCAPPSVPRRAPPAVAIGVQAEAAWTRDARVPAPERLGHPAGLAAPYRTAGSTGTGSPARACRAA